MKTYAGPVLFSSLLFASTAACDPDCETLLNCGPYPLTTDGGASNSTSTGGSGGNGPGGFAPGGAGGQGGESSGGAGGTVVPSLLAAGESHTLAAFSDGAAKAWGSNSHGQLGLGSGEGSDSSLPIDVLLNQIVEVAGGLQHSCARVSDGSVWCVGRNQHGQLGDGTNMDSTTWVQVSALAEVTQISAAGNITCARLVDATARCWGQGASGALGDGSATGSNIPVVFQQSGVAKISTGGATTCVLVTGGSVRCAGEGSGGQLGNGSTNDSPVPVTVTGIADAIDVDTGNGPSTGHSCVIRGSNSQVSCWGINNYGQIGNGSFGGNVAAPSPVAGIAGAVSVAIVGQGSSCVVLVDGSTRCWGRNQLGQLGNGTLVDASTPTQVMGLTNASQVAAGANHACVLTEANEALCWGLGTSGQLGIGSDTSSNQPLQVKDF